MTSGGRHGRHPPNGMDRRRVSPAGRGHPAEGGEPGVPDRPRRAWRHGCCCRVARRYSALGMCPGRLGGERAFISTAPIAKLGRSGRGAETLRRARGGGGMGRVGGGARGMPGGGAGGGGAGGVGGGGGGRGGWCGGGGPATSGAGKSPVVDHQMDPARSTPRRLTARVGSREVDAPLGVAAGPSSSAVPEERIPSAPTSSMASAPSTDSQNRLDMRPRRAATADTNHDARPRPAQGPVAAGRGPRRAFRGSAGSAALAARSPAERLLVRDTPARRTPRRVQLAGERSERPRPRRVETFDHLVEREDR